jgi:hypothetical protein
MRFFHSSITRTAAAGVGSALATFALLGCSGASDNASSATSEAAYTGDAGADASPRAACSLGYWDWVLHTLEPQLEKPITEVSDAQMTALVAAHPPAEENKYAYSACWTPVFDKYVYAAGVGALHKADVDFVFRGGLDHRDYARYKAKVAMTPELRRNAKALLALKPATMTPSDVGAWMTAYSDTLAEVIHPVGIPGPQMYEGVVEAEWVITDDEAEYLTVMEKAVARPSKDGVYSEWVPYFQKWLFGPPPSAASRSFVFNLPFEQGATGDSYGLAGVSAAGGTASMPPNVNRFVDRLKSSMPLAIGDSDSARWFSFYNARALRAIGDLPQNEPLLTSTDILALDILEAVKPAKLQGSFTYGSWLDLYVIAAGEHDPAWATRIARAEPCVAASELVAAQQTFAMKTGSLRRPIAAPHVCAD